VTLDRDDRRRAIDSPIFRRTTNLAYDEYGQIFHLRR